MSEFYEKILTDDGSMTFYNAKFDETYHSLSGAFEEATEKYLKPLGIKDGMKILDFCFGLGYNSFVAINKCKDLNIIGLEIDKGIVGKIKDLDVPEEIRSTFKKFGNIGELKSITDNKNNTLQLIFGDARKTMLELEPNSFDAIFFDPFSPKKHPEMWEKEIFEHLYKLLKPCGKLATYSCAKKVRNNLKEAGFNVYDGPSVGRVAPSTIAEKPAKQPS